MEHAGVSPLPSDPPFAPHRYLGLQFFFEVGAFLCFGAVYLILSRQEREASQAQETKAEPEKEKLAGNSIKTPESKV